jgi:hypothetical protein
MNRRQAVKFRPAVAPTGREPVRTETKVFAKNEAEEFEDFSTKSRPRAGDRLKAIARVAEAGSLLCHGKTQCNTFEKPAFQSREEKNIYHCQGCNCHNSAPLCQQKQERRTLAECEKHDEEEEDEDADLDNIIAKLRTGSSRPLRR